MKRQISTIISLIVIFFAITPTAQADSPSAIKSRMSKRLTQVIILKKNASIGENNKGFLSTRKTLTEVQKLLVAAENADRRAVYGIISAKTKSSAARVGKARAASIRKSAVKGTWIQLANGAWKQQV